MTASGIISVLALIMALAALTLVLVRSYRRTQRYGRTAPALDLSKWSYIDLGAGTRRQTGTPLVRGAEMGRVVTGGTQLPPQPGDEVRDDGTILRRFPPDAHHIFTKRVHRLPTWKEYREQEAQKVVERVVSDWWETQLPNLKSPVTDAHTVQIPLRTRPDRVNTAEKFWEV